MNNIYCPSKCEYCARDKFLNAYKNKQKYMSLDDFSLILAKVPQGSIISFAGFSEPLSHPDCIEMVLMAHARNFPIHFLTTCVGMTIEKYNRIKHIPFLSFSIHIADENGKTNYPITEQYKTALKYILNNRPNGLLFNHHSGSIHPDLQDMGLKSVLLEIHDRAGNVETNDSILHANKIDISKCKHVFLHTFFDGSGVILPNLEVISCCMDMNLEHIIGDLKTENWETIHNRSKPMELCKKCVFGY